MYDEETIKWHMKPWFAAIDANTGSIMPGYAGADFLDPRDNSCGGCPDRHVCWQGACVLGGHGGGDSYPIIAYLRDTMGYDGVITTDWLPSSAWAGSACAGSDVMGGANPVADNFTMDTFISEVRSERLDDAVARVLSLKFRLGLFENPYPDLDEVESVWKDPDHKDLAILSALKSMTLIRNNGALPLNLKAGDVMVAAGPAAVNFNAAYANPDELVDWGQSTNFYSIWTSYFHGWPGEFGPAESIFDGLVERGQALGIDVVAEDDPLASQAEAVVLGLGEPSYTHGVYWHRTDNTELVEISQDQLDLITYWTGQDIPVIVVLISPRPMVITDWHESVDALMLAYRPGDGVGRAVGQIVFGLYVPRGRLPFQLPRTEEQIGGDTRETAVEQWDLPYDLGASDADRLEIRDYINQGQVPPTTYGDPLYPYGYGMTNWTDTDGAPSETEGGVVDIDGSTDQDTDNQGCESVETVCDPVGSDSLDACQAPAQCFVDDTGTTLCGCASQTAGTQNANCAEPTDCQHGLVCITSTCRTVCDPSVTPSTCEGGLPCQAIGGSTTVGYCES